MGTRQTPAAAPQPGAGAVAGHIELDHVGRLLYEAYCTLTRQIEDLEAQRARVREQLEARIGGHAEARIDGRPVITWRPSKPSTYVDTKALARDHPDIYAAYLREKKAARPFRLVGDQQ